MTPRLIRLVRAGLAGLSALAGLAAVAPAFGTTATDALYDPGFLVATAGAVIVVTGLGISLARLLPLVRLSVELAVLAGYVLVATAPGLSIVDGPKRLLTAALPLDRGGAELATVALGLGLAAIGAVEPALRQTNPVPPLAAPVLAVAAGYALAAPGGVPPWWLAAGLILAAAGQLLLAERECRTPTTGSVVQSAVGTLLAVGLVAVAGLAGAGAVPATPAAARDLVPQPVIPREAVSPLSLFPALRTGRLPLELTVESADRPQRLRYATLTRFDGTYWSADAAYRRAGHTLPVGPPTGPARIVEDRVHIVVPGPLSWLVSQGRPVSISIPGLGVDEDTGDVLITADQPVPVDYTVRSQVPGYAETDLPDAAPVPRSAGADPLIPADLAGQAVQLAGGEYGYPALARLAGYFARDGGFSQDTGPQAPAGHGTYQIRRLLRDKRGTAEQYSSAFAVLARALGYDTRVAVGFRTRPVSGRLRVTGRDIDAWPEVRFAGLGWVAFTPTPRSGAAVPHPVSSPSSAPRPSASPPAPTQVTTDHPSRTTRGAGPTVGPSTSWATVATVLGGLVMGLLLAAGPGYRWVRRRYRRSTADPARCATGAWREALDGLRAAGLAVPRSASSGWVAGEVRRRFADRAGEEAAGLATVHDRIAYGPGAPSAADADRAWQHADRLRLAVRSRLSVAGRLRAFLRPVTGRSGEPFRFRPAWRIPRLGAAATDQPRERNRDQHPPDDRYPPDRTPRRARLGRG